MNTNPDAVWVGQSLIDTVKDNYIPVIRINAPGLFANPEFQEWLNTRENIATWHERGDQISEGSDVFVTYDCDEGSDSDMPHWDVLCAAVRDTIGTAKSALLWITNLDS